MRILQDLELKIVQGGRTKSQRCYDSFPVTDFSSVINKLFVGSIVCSIVEVEDKISHPWRLL